MASSCVALNRRPRAAPGSTLLGLLALVVAGLGPALGQAGEQGLPPEPRTVSWYADHPRARAKVQLACIDDPGHLADTPDCVNAHQASVEVALRKARGRASTLDPRDPAYWSSIPANRRSKLNMCRRNPELTNCDAARRSLEIEAGEAGG